MGFFKKVFKPVRKIAKKIIPKEVRPFLPYIAAGFGPATAGLSFGSGLGTALAKRALIAGATSAATDEQGDPLRAGLLAIAPNVAAEGLGAVASKFPMAGDDPTATFSFAEKIGEGARRGQDFIERQGAIKTIGAQTALDQSAKFAEINQDEIDKYNEELRKQGVLDKTKRRTSILNIYLNAGYEPEYVNSMLDRYGYDEGGLAKLRKQYDALMSKMRAPETVAKTSAKLRRKLKDDETMIPPKKPKDPEDKDEEEPVLVKDVDKDLAGGLMAAARGVEQAFGMPFSGAEPVPMLRFAQGGEVEIEEETDDLGIMDLMRDQGVEYGEQVSNAQNDELLEKLFEEFLDMGFSPEDAAKKAREAFDNMSQGQGITGTQVASGYKTDIEEMYEQYVFEMEEQGLQPMSFSQFLAQARSGMAGGGRVGFTKGGDVMRGVDRGIDPLEVLDILKEFKRIKEKYGYEMSFDDYLDGEMFADGGDVKRRKKGEPEDEIIETEEEIFIDKMPRPKRQGIMEAADGGIMEKDMRGGGFIPEGTKERADDVPARLSKNEFVMTADAVRAAGGGSVNKGAKRMYDMMYNLEGQV